MKNLDKDELYLHCDECEQGWLNPEKVEDIGSSFLTLEEEFEAEEATSDDLKDKSWEKYALRSFEE